MAIVDDHDVAERRWSRHATLRSDED